MSPCAGRPSLALIAGFGEIAPDIVFTLRSHQWYDTIGASYASVRSRPVFLPPHFGNERHGWQIEALYSFNEQSLWWRLK